MEEMLEILIWLESHPPYSLETLVSKQMSNPYKKLSLQ
jgi:hypothetical protein